MPVPGKNVRWEAFDGKDDRRRHDKRDRGPMGTNEVEMGGAEAYMVWRLAGSVSEARNGSNLWAPRINSPVFQAVVDN